MATYLYAVCLGVRGDADSKRELILEAVGYGENSIGKNEVSSEAHKWFAIVVGSRSEYVGIKEKILDGYEFKKHVDRAAELAPRDHTIQHLLGRSVYNYISVERGWFGQKGTFECVFET